MESQFTDFENAAFAIFVVLLSRVISTFDLNFYIPLSKVDENMEKAHNVDALFTEKFYFRKHVVRGNLDGTFKSDAEIEQDECELMTINEIINGKDNGFPGLITLMNLYFDTTQIEKPARDVMNKYLKLISDRASGKLTTAAKWIRSYVMSHNSYKQDSIVTQDIAYDLLKTIQKIQQGTEKAPTLLGDLYDPNFDPSAAIATTNSSHDHCC